MTLKKQCVRCGKGMEIEDWYAFIRTKYCPVCAEDVKREQAKFRMREVRRLSREKHALEHELCKRQRDEIERLRAEIVRLRECGGYV